jgi:hypothetical protein
MIHLGKYLPGINENYQKARGYLAVLDNWDDSLTADIQLSKLKDVWRDAVADVPYYARIAREGLAPAQIHTWDDFYSIPELTRDILQDQPEQFVRISGPPDLTRMTGGSTGNPVKFGVWKSEDQIIRFLKLVLWAKVGYVPADRLFLIWGHAHLLGTGWPKLWNYFQRKMRDVLLGYKRVDAHTLSTAKCQKYADDISNFCPAGIIGYSAALDYFVRSLPDRAENFHNLGLKFVMPCAEPAPRDDSFELIGKIFGCPVVQEFGGVDFGHVAMKYGKKPFEVFPEHNILEVKTESLGAAALVTSLYRRYLPLIRYRQGDMLGDYETLQHGHVVRFQTLQGRLNDMVELNDGTVIHSLAVAHCIRLESSILNMQILLENLGPKILLATTPEYDQAVEQRIRGRLGQVALSLEKVVIERVPDVQTTRAGKRRWIIDKRTQ